MLAYKAVKHGARYEEAFPTRGLTVSQTLE